VVFLALVLEGGLWASIAERIRSVGDATVPVRAFVSSLQLFAVLILLAGTVSEILALYALLKQQASQTTEDVIFYSTSFLVALLGLALAAKIPGFVVGKLSAISLQLDEGEVLRWSGRCARLVPRPRPWMWGKLFLTDKRMVWMTIKEFGLMAAARVEIQSGHLASINTNAESMLTRLSRHLPSTTILPYSIPKGYFFDAINDSGNKYRLCVKSDQEEIMQYLEPLIASPEN
jgi:hypothetical protein